jgi:type VI secretion system protein ImpE
MQAEQLLREGRLDEALTQLQDEIRADPAKVELRAFLFQLLSVLGDWDRAMTQLNVSAEMDAGKLVLGEICRPALNAEALRASIFAGEKSPLVFGEPEEWVVWMMEANRLAAREEYAGAQELRERAFDAAPAIAGTVDGQPFEWIADADTRLGPILEAVVDGKYFWVPFPRVKAISIQPPAALWNVVWAQAQFIWANGGRSPGLIPARYVGTEAHEDPLLRLGRRTEWIERDGGLFIGVGQRMLATDGGEYPLLEVRQITLNAPETGGADEPAPAGDEPAEQEPPDG